MNFTILANSHILSKVRVQYKKFDMKDYYPSWQDSITF